MDEHYVWTPVACFNYPEKRFHNPFSSLISSLLHTPIYGGRDTTFKPK